MNYLKEQKENVYVNDVLERNHIKNDSFKKIIIVKDDIMRNRNEDGIITMGVFDFLTDPNSLEY